MSKTIILMLIACLLAACAPSQQAVEAAIAFATSSRTTSTETDVGRLFIRVFSCWPSSITSHLSSKSSTQDSHNCFFCNNDTKLAKLIYRQTRAVG